MRHLLISIFLIITCNTLTAQDKDSSSTQKKVLLLPVPAIGKSIETGWYFGAVGLFTFKNFFRTPQYSTAKAEINITLKKQLILSTSWFLYTHENRMIIIGDNAYLYFPENFYGIGNNTPASNEIYYEARRIELYNSALWKIKPLVYAGVSVKAQGIAGLDIGNTLSETGNELERNNAGWSVGIGPHLLMDKRDRILNPSAGSFLTDVENINYIKEKHTHGSAAFSAIKTDLRYYHKLLKRSVLAWQLYSINTLGYAPYRLMGLLGSDSHMRGYYQGRYRDKNYTAAQAEARIRILPWAGFTVFGGAGDVWSSPGDVSWGNIKYSLGGGLRIRVDKIDQINLRLDYAVGRETSGFYVAFGEAF